MSDCKLCSWLCRQVCGDASDALWQRSRDWERASCNEAELWQRDHDVEILNEANELWVFDRERSIKKFVEIAENKFPPIMHFLGRSFEYGWIVDADWSKAQHWYVGAIEEGSWMATLDYARLLDKAGYFRERDQVLENGIEVSWAPSYFWLAWFRQKRSPRRKTYREIKPLLIYAAERGHPAAQALRVRFTLFGKFGWREIPHGFKLAREQFARLQAQDAAKENVSQPDDAVVLTAAEWNA